MTKDLDNKAIFSQRDSRWKNVTLGKTKYTLGAVGCTTTAACRAIFKLIQWALMPNAASQLFKYTDGGLLIWGSIANLTIPFSEQVKAYRYYRRPTDKEIKACTNDAGQAMLLELSTNLPLRHWVCLEKNSVQDWYQVMDPLIGKMSKIKKSRVIGFAIFSKI